MNHIFVQVRYNSARLRGKVLKKIDKKPLLQFLINRLQKIKKSRIIVLTSTIKSDDRIVKLCKENSIEFFRGSHLNVYQRYCDAINYYKPTFFVRICGDSPLQNKTIITKMIDLYKKKHFNIISNVFPRSFPIGMSVEIIQSQFFLQKKKFIINKNFKEHVTSYFYKKERKYIFNFKSKKNYSKIDLSINTKNDYEKIKKFIENNEKKINNFDFIIKYFKKK
jgi:spore coat polysaccharide biosynthesis protein SpsF